MLRPHFNIQFFPTLFHVFVETLGCLETCFSCLVLYLPRGVGVNVENMAVVRPSSHLSASLMAWKRFRDFGGRELVSPISISFVGSGHLFLDKPTVQPSKQQVYTQCITTQCTHGQCTTVQCSVVPSGTVCSFVQFSAIYCSLVQFNAVQGGAVYCSSV